MKRSHAPVIASVAAVLAATVLATAVLLLAAAPAVGQAPISAALLGDSKELKPTCSFSEEEFIGGLDGYCFEDGDEYKLFFENFDGAEVLSFAWPGDLDDPPAADCESLCDAGALTVAYSTDLLNVEDPALEVDLEASLDDVFGPAFKSGGGCPLNRNADVEYEKCGGGSFRCFLACGKGCVGCEVKVGGECGGGQACRWHDFQCYTRPCCDKHDRCLADAGNDILQQLICHLAALFDGCGLADAAGQTSNRNDATCLNFTECIKTAAKIGGRVWRDVNRDGYQDANEPGLGGARVDLVGEDGKVVAAATSGEDGTYRFDELEGGVYAVLIDTGEEQLEPTFDFDGVDTPDSATVKLEPGAEVLVVDFGYAGIDNTLK